MKKIAIICDFDGTISVKDVNYSIFRAYGGKEALDVEMSYWNSEIGLRESLKTQYKISKVNAQKFEEFVINEMQIDEAFFSLFDYCKKNNIELAIVSGGFINYIEILFSKYNRKIDVPIYSNKLHEENGIIVPDYDRAPECVKTYGPCGICKYKLILEYKKKYKVIYVGDGHTDRCAAENADIVFAKSHLEKFCIEDNIKYTPYKTFKDVENYVRKLNLGNNDGLECEF